MDSRGRKLMADEIIEGILLLSHRKRFPGDLSDFHSMFERIKKEIPSLLQEFIFSTNDLYPYSKLLERVLFRLFNSEIIEIRCIPNPGQTQFLVSSLVTDEETDRLKKEFEREGILGEIETAARLFADLCDMKEKSLVAS